MTDVLQKELGFIKSLFLGKLKESLLVPYPKGRPEEEETIKMFSESLKRFSQMVDPRKIDEEEKIPEEIIEEMKQLGILSMTVPEEYGGFGFSHWAYGKVVEQLTAISPAIAVFVGAHLSIGIKGIILFGTPEQKKKYLEEAVVKQGKIACFALTEETAGCDVSGIRTRAVPSADGKYFIINGSKQWITNAELAGLMTLVAKTELEVEGKKKDKLTAFIVTKDMGNFLMGRDEKKMGIHGSVTNIFSLENVRVPRENLLGEFGQGFKIAMEILNTGRLGLAAGCIGAARQMIELSIQHSKQREQFGQKLHVFEMIREKLVEMCTDLFAMEAMVDITTKIADQGHVDFSIEAAICKVFSTEALWRIVNHAVQINGGNGYMREYPYERMLRDSRINMIFEGTNEILRLFIALEGAKLPGEELLALKKLMANPLKALGKIVFFLAREIKNVLAFPRMKNIDKLLEPEAAQLAKLSSLFAQRVKELLFKYGHKILQKEYMQERLSNAAIYLYAGYCLVAKIEELLVTKGQGNISLELDMFHHFTSRAFARLSTDLASVIKNQDRLCNKIAEGILQRESFQF